MKWLDTLHARYHNDGLFFRGGWGDEALLHRTLVLKEEPEALTLAPLKSSETTRVLRFPSPESGALPEESRIAEALLVLPEDWNSSTPVCVQLAATGDEGFMARKQVVAEPLLELGIGSLILENPYYGCRKPQEQHGTYLTRVSDLWAMGLAIVAESRALLNWLRCQGFEHLAIVGVSLGGAMASQTAALSSLPLACCCCIAPHSATPVYLDGVLSNYVDWEALEGEVGRLRLAEQLNGSDLARFPIPKRPDSSIWLAARRDAYVDPNSSMKAAELWPGSSLRWLNNGHVGTTLFHRNDYIRGITDAFRLLRAAPHPPIWFP